MKKLLLTSAFFCFFVLAYSQSDTLFTKKHEKIPCKIIEINETDFKYKLADNPDGPVFVAGRTTITKYVLSNGYTQQVIPDEMSIEEEHKEILGNRTAIKIHPFSFVNNQFSFAYEKVIKVGMNLDVEFGYSNSNLNGQQDVFGNNYYNGTNTGAYIKPGVKFFLGQDYSVKGMKYAHPLKGRYIKLDLGFSYLNFQNLKHLTGGYNGTTYTTNTVSSNANTFAYGGFVNYGRQFILGNILTLEYYIGLGLTGLSYSYTNPNYTKNQSYGPYYNSYYDDVQNTSNFHGFMRTQGLGLSYTGGFRIGYIIPAKKNKVQPTKKN
jgi:hypothetical protein